MFVQLQVKLNNFGFFATNIISVCFTVVFLRRSRSSSASSMASSSGKGSAGTSSNSSFSRPSGEPATAASQARALFRMLETIAETNADTAIDVQSEILLFVDSILDVIFGRTEINAAAVSQVRTLRWVQNQFFYK